VLRELKKLGESDATKYGQFFEAYGQVLKEGLAIDPSAREEILPLLRYKSSRSNGGWVSLDDYVKRMPDGQEDIYYVISDSLQAAARSPHLDAFNARGLEVLFWHDALDVFLAPIIDQYHEKKLRNVADADVSLPTADEGDEKAAEEQPISEPALNRFIGKCVTTLGQRVSEVRVSRVLRDNPVRLVSPGGQEADLQRIYRMMGREYETPQLIFEINSRHPLIAGLATLISGQPDSPFIVPAIEQLYAGALMQEGLHPNPGEMLPRIQEVMQFAVDALNKAGSPS
jgi:molecular chaperone HtpG